MTWEYMLDFYGVTDIDGLYEKINNGETIADAARKQLPWSAFAYILALPNNEGNIKLDGDSFSVLLDGQTYSGLKVSVDGDTMTVTGGPTDTNVFDESGTLVLTRIS